VGLGRLVIILLLISRAKSDSRHSLDDLQQTSPSIFHSKSDSGHSFNDFPSKTSLSDFHSKNQILINLLMVFTAKPVSRIFTAKSDSHQSFDGFHSKTSLSDFHSKIRVPSIF
jgi:hypothetical protein